MHVNNEIGSIQPIQEISKHLKTLKDKVYLHVDAVQSYAKINFRPSRYNIDFMSVSGHKVHGPKGIGFIYVKENNRINRNKIRNRKYSRYIWLRRSYKNNK